MTTINKGGTVRCGIKLLISALIALTFFHFLHKRSSDFQSLVGKYFIVPGPGGIALTEANLTEFAMDDPTLLSFIQQHYVITPSGLPYNLTEPNRVHFGQYPEVEDAVVRLFKNKTGGTFFEGGAFNGEHISGTLYFEKTLNWNGLLVEPFPVSIESIKARNRKATLVTSCVSGAKPVQLVLKCKDEDSTWGCEVHPIDQTDDENRRQAATPNLLEQKLWCFPLYSVLLATKFTTIDYMILDMEYHEETVLRALPLDKVNITIVQIETGPNRQRHEAVRAIFRRWPKYKEYKLFPIDMMFINRELMPVLNEKPSAVNNDELLQKRLSYQHSLIPVVYFN